MSSTVVWVKVSGSPTVVVVKTVVNSPLATAHTHRFLVLATPVLPSGRVKGGKTDDSGMRWR
jgi:hypothetical protein